MRVGTNSGAILSHLWTKVHEILGQRRRPLVLSNNLALLSVICKICKFDLDPRMDRRPSHVAADEPNAYDWAQGEAEVRVKL